LGISNTATFDRITDLSKEIKKIGLQFSIHKSCDYDRNQLIPYHNKMTLNQIRDCGLIWWKETGRKVYLNYCVERSNSRHSDFIKLNLFSPVAFNYTFSVICSNDEADKQKGFNDIEYIRNFSQYFVDAGYNTRIFNPDGQDDIGGGCGQLWYVQKWMKEYKK
jgi:23S rRNA (adenine2503-C2)-methyltransferase